MAVEKVYTDKQLVEVLTTDGLTIVQLERRTLLIKLQREETGLEAAARENEKAIAAREQELRTWRAKCEDIKKNDEENRRIQEMCLHTTGGQDRHGFYAGQDEAGYGRCVSRQTLPTGEKYAICFRCVKEWHHPAWTEQFFAGHDEKLSLRKAVTMGLFPVSEYFRLEAEWKLAMGWKARTFEGISGQIPEPCQFHIPALRERHAREEQEFRSFLLKLPTNEVVLAGGAKYLQA